MERLWLPHKQTAFQRLFIRGQGLDAAIVAGRHAGLATVLEARLGLLDVRVIPVLVGGADMPKVSDLPDPLKDLVYRNAAVIEASDVRALQNALKQFVKQTTGDQVPITSANGNHRQQATASRHSTRPHAAPQSRSRVPAHR